MAQGPSDRNQGRAVALVAAAGAGHRLGADVPKAFFSIGGATILQHCVRNLADSQAFDDIVVMASFDMCNTAARQVEALGLSIPVRVFPGGVLRSDSIYEGVKRIMADDDDDNPVSIIAVHDAARCLAPPDMVADLIEKTRLLMSINNLGAVVPALPLVDTVKFVDSDGNVIGTPDRTRLRRVQTPQVFDALMLWKAHQAARREGVNTTDDAALFEYYDFSVLTVQGDERAFKITTPFDLHLAELVLSHTTKE